MKGSDNTQDYFPKVGKLNFLPLHYLPIRVLGSYGVPTSAIDLRLYLHPFSRECFIANNFVV